MRVIPVGGRHTTNLFNQGGCMTHTFVITVRTSKLAKAEHSTEDEVVESVTHAITEALEFIKPEWNLDDILEG
jgi:hypothetical protein